MFANNVTSIEINKVMFFDINDEKNIVSLFICEMFKVTTCANELSNIILSKIFNIITSIIIAYFIIYLILFA